MCRFCSYGFCTDHELNDHVKSEHPEAKHPCKTCGKRFTSRAFLQRHSLSHTGEKPHKCTMCERAFTRAETLRDHMKTHNDEASVIKCDLCNFECSNSQKLKRHMQQQHAKHPRHTCSVCSYEGDTESEVLSHIQDAHSVGDEAVVVPYPSTNENKEECNLCGQTFTQHSNLKRHMLIHLGVSKFKCEECGDSFTRNAGLQSHLVKVHNHDPQEIYYCKKCDFKGQSRHALEAHNQAEHKVEFKYECDLCTEFSSIDKNEFIAHVSEVHKVAYTYFCKFCEKGHQTKSGLLDHIKDEHGSSKVHECAECGERFLRRSSYVRHMRTQHLKERPFKCERCGLTFDRREKLLRHMKTHNSDETMLPDAESTLMECSDNFENLEDMDDVTPSATQLYGSPTKKLLSGLKLADRTLSQGTKVGSYRCDICSKDFSSKRSLARHTAGHANKRAISTDEDIAKIQECQHHSYRLQNQLHHCVECGDTFSRRGARNRHYRTVHLLIKAFKCDICQKAFTRQDTLKSHLQNHTDYDTKGHCCEVCKMGFESEAGLRIHMKLLHKYPKVGLAVGNGIDCADEDETLTLIAERAGSSDDCLVAIELPLDTIHMEQSDEEVLIGEFSHEHNEDNIIEKDVNNGVDDADKAINEAMESMLQTVTAESC